MDVTRRRHVLCGIAVLVVIAGAALSYGGTEGPSGESDLPAISRAQLLAARRELLAHIFENGRVLTSFGLSGNLYFVDGSSLFAISPEGVLLWEYSGLAIVIPPNEQPDGTVCLGAWYGDGGLLVSLGPDGREQWRFPLDDWMPTSIVAGSDGVVYASVPLLPRVYAVNPDGTLRWESSAGGAILSLFVGREGKVFASSMDTLCFYAFDSAGTMSWSLELSDCLLGQGSCTDDGVIYARGSSGRVYALADTGALKWSFDPRTPFCKPESIEVADDGSIRITTCDWTYALSSEGSPIPEWSAARAPVFEAVLVQENCLSPLGSDGTPLWRLCTEEPLENQPVVQRRGIAYVLSQDRSTLYAIDSTSGTLVWKLKLSL